MTRKLTLKGRTENTRMNKVKGLSVNGLNWNQHCDNLHSTLFSQNIKEAMKYMQCAYYAACTPLVPFHQLFPQVKEASSSQVQ